MYRCRQSRVEQNLWVCSVLSAVAKMPRLGSDFRHPVAAHPMAPCVTAACAPKHGQLLYADCVGPAQRCSGACLHRGQPAESGTAMSHQPVWKHSRVWSSAAGTGSCSWLPHSPSRRWVLSPSINKLCTGMVWLQRIQKLPEWACCSARSIFAIRSEQTLVARRLQGEYNRSSLPSS